MKSLLGMEHVIQCVNFLKFFLGLIVKEIPMKKLVNLLLSIVLKICFSYDYRRLRKF